MPWLIKDQPDQDNLLFVHVPRCGGTSLMKCHDVPTKVMEGRSWWGRLGMRTFFDRYALLEQSNFPLWTRTNYICWALFLVALYGLSTQKEPNLLWILLLAGSMTTFVCLTYIFTAPVIGRVTPIRRGYLILIHRVLLRFMESIDWCTGCNQTGYMNHLTAHKLLAHGYVTPDTMEAVSSMAIVRNPYSRMISIYMYNRFGPLESLESFLKRWYTLMEHYRTRGEMEEWYTPCHCLPQFQYTHFQGTQLVQSIVKQEELKYLKLKGGEAEVPDSSVKELPNAVRNALLGMPHTNARHTDDPWWTLYNQTTLDLTYELYQEDFDVFGYSPELAQRPDLMPPAGALRKQQQSRDVTTPTTNDLPKLEPMRRNSLILSEDRQRRRRASIRESSVTSASRTSMKPCSEQARLDLAKMLVLLGESNRTLQQQNGGGEQAKNEQSSLLAKEAGYGATGANK